VTFIKPKKIEEKKKVKSEKNITNANGDKIQVNPIKRNSMITLIENPLKETINTSMYESEKSGILNVNTQGNVNTPQQMHANPKGDNKNHALRFSQYSHRKDPNIKNKWQLPIISYLEPFDYVSKNKGINFEKMSERQDTDIKQKLNSASTPSICYYQPKYDYVMKTSPRAIKFNTKEKQKYKNKKYLVQKMWRSYDVSTDYKLVKLKSYVEERKN
jgi:hypothetical protein